MSKTTDGSALALVEVPFHGDVIDAVQDDRGVWVPLRRLCENLGINEEGQRQRLRRKVWAKTDLVRAMDSTGRRVEVFCLHLDYLPLWLATIQVSRVREGSLAKVRLYQDKAAQAILACLASEDRRAEDSSRESLNVEELLLAQSRALLAHKRQLLEMEARVARVEHQSARADREPLSPVRTSGDPISRAKLNEVVRLHVKTTGASYPDVWETLYVELHNRCDFDAHAWSSSDRTPLDAVEQAGLMADLYIIASEILVIGLADRSADQCEE